MATGVVLGALGADVVTRQVTGTGLLERAGDAFNEAVPDGFIWGAYSQTGSSECAYVGVVASHTLRPGENVEFHVQPFIGNYIQNSNTAEDEVVDLSGRPIVVTWRRLCVPQEGTSQTGILFQAENGSVKGEVEIYEFPH